MPYYAVVYNPATDRNIVLKFYYIQDVMGHDGIKKGVFTQIKQAHAVCDKLNKQLNERDANARS